MNSKEYVNSNKNHINIPLERNQYFYLSFDRISTVKHNAKSGTCPRTVSKQYPKFEGRRFVNSRGKDTKERTEKWCRKEPPTRVASSSQPRRKGRNSQVDLLPIPSSYPRYFNIGYGNKLRIDVKAASPPLPLPACHENLLFLLFPLALYTSNVPLLLLLLPLCPILSFCFSISLSLSLLFFRSSGSPWYMRTGGVI